MPSKIKYLKRKLEQINKKLRVWERKKIKYENELEDLEELEE